MEATLSHERDTERGFTEQLGWREEKVVEQQKGCPLCSNVAEKEAMLLASSLGQ